MLMINDVDYTFYILAVLSLIIIVALFFGGQYTLCKKGKHMAIKLIPVYIVLLLVAAAILVATGDTGGSPIDMRGVVSLMILGIALVCALSAGAAWLTHKRQKTSSTSTQDR